MKTQTSRTGFMPRNVAIALLTSGQAMPNPFRKRCIRATERVCEPVSRSTALPISAPKTGEQRLHARLHKANAKQLHTWAKRTLARGNRLQDARDEFAAEAHNAEGAADTAAALEIFAKQIAAHDALLAAISSELTSRASRGKGYKT